MQFVELIPCATQNAFATIVRMHPCPLSCPTRLGILIFTPAKTARPNPHAGPVVGLVDEQIGRVWFLVVLLLLSRRELLSVVAELAAIKDGEAFYLPP